jgi:putative PIN family toxin of toxin-antitoxin system
MTIVLDTNVLVSGLISTSSPPARILDLVIIKTLTLIYDVRILTEYREVLLRKKFKFDPQKINDILEFIEKEGIFVTPPQLSISLPDSSDLPFIECAHHMSIPLVTGNKKHFPRKTCHTIRILTPSQFFGK